MLCKSIAVAVAAFSLLSVLGISAQEGGSIHLVKTVSLPGYTGDFDHSAVDRARNRILLAAEDHSTLEVFDLKTGEHLRSVKGFDTPHSILIRLNSKTIFVTDGGPSMSKLIGAESLDKKASVNLVPGADSIGYDPSANVVYVVTGGMDVKMPTSTLVAVDPDSGKKLGELVFNDNHVEAMAVEKSGDRLFINLTQTNSVAVVNRKTMKVLATWHMTAAKQNAMAQLDEAKHRLYVVCRKPGMVVALDSDTGKVVSTAPAPGHSDDAIMDSATHRLYVPGGDGYLGIYDTSDPNHIIVKDKIHTAAGAKTGLLLSEEGKLMLVASPGESKAMAKVLFYSIR